MAVIRGTCFVFLALILYGCDKEPEDGNIYSHTYQEKAKIELSGDPEFLKATVNKGENLVFKYYFQQEADPLTADSGYAESIVFEVSPELDTFSYANDELLQQKVFFDRFCFCPREGSIPLNQGIISGTKIDDFNWSIKIVVSFDDYGYTESKNIDNTFVNEITFSFSDTGD